VYYLELGIEGMMILKLIFKKWDEAWTGLIWFRTDQGACECGSDPSVSIKCGGFLV